MDDVVTHRAMASRVAGSCFDDWDTRRCTTALERLETALNPVLRSSADGGLAEARASAQADVAYHLALSTAPRSLGVQPENALLRARASVAAGHAALALFSCVLCRPHLDTVGPSVPFCARRTPRLPS